jgi:hypothetical protein
MTARVASPRAAIALTEEQFLQQVRQLAQICGWITYHTRDSRRSDPGYPDLSMFHRGQGRALFVELKKHDGRLSGPQVDWLTMISESGFEADVWRPADMPRIKAILRGQSIPTHRATEEFH